MTTATIVQTPVVSSIPLPTSASSTKSAPLPFTLQSLKASIPAKCFQKSTATSIYYFLRDYAFIALCYYVQPVVFAYGMIPAFLWMNVVGFLFWCLFVVGHDCGHGTFSDIPLVNEVFGVLSHAPILVPFTGWQRSHFLHHTHHNDVEHDHSWKPISRTEYSEFLKDNSFSGKLNYFMRFSYGLLVLYPVYLLTEKSSKASGNHFNPYSRLFEPEQRLKAGISSVSVIVALTCIFMFSPTYTFFIFCYVIPYFIFCVWLDMVTFLHHTSTESTYYRNLDWSYLKGALSTIDRSYGFLIEHLHHDIGTHVVHHLFFTGIPHYNLREANAALKVALGSYYMYDDTPFYIALFKQMKACKYVDDTGNVVKFKNDEQYMNEITQEIKKTL